MTALSLIGAVSIGLSLGLTGAGGSILTVPVLVYLAGIKPDQAINMSLLIVGTAALVGALQRARTGGVHYQVAALFALSGFGGVWGGAKLTHLLTPQQLMITFAGLMVVVGLRMLQARKTGMEATQKSDPVTCLLAGGGVGVLTGFLGVGGGFLLVPALMRFGRLPLRVATGTSLAIIACNSAVGFVRHSSHNMVPTPWVLVTVFAAIAGLGVMAGGKAASRLPEATLRRAFALLVLVTAGYMFWKPA